MGILQVSHLTAAREIEYKQNPLSSFLDVSRNNGFALMKNMPYDGNCFFSQRKGSYRVWKSGADAKTYS